MLTVDQSNEERGEVEKKKVCAGIVPRLPYDSTNCIRFKGYALSSVLMPEHPYSEFFINLTAWVKNIKLFDSGQIVTAI